MKKIDRIGDFLLKFMVIPYSILLQFIYVPTLPEKYFYDSTVILNGVNGNIPYYLSKSYKFAIDFFSKINFLGFTTFREWAIMFTILFSCVVFAYLLRYRKLKVIDFIFIYATVSLANIYIFRISKDIIQLSIWFVVFFILQMKKEKLKNTLLILIFLFEGLYFRTYYLLILPVYYIVAYLFSNNNKLKIRKIIFLGVFFIIIILFFIKFVFPNIYLDIINLRYNLNVNRIDSMDVVTVINDVFNNSNPFLYVINYIINFFRIIFPIELLFKGLKYSVFFIYQVSFALYIIRSYKKIKDNSAKKNVYNCEFLFMLLSYLLVSNLFEPDFGSLIRHETALLFLFIHLFFDDINKKM